MFSKIYNSYNAQHDATQFSRFFQLNLFVKITVYINKNVNVFQTLFYTNAISTHNFVHNVSKNFTPTFLSQIVSFFKKNFFLKLLYSEAILFSIALSHCP